MPWINHETGERSEGVPEYTIEVDGFSHNPFACNCSLCREERVREREGTTEEEPEYADSYCIRCDEDYPSSQLTEHSLVGNRYPIRLCGSCASEIQECARCANDYIPEWGDDELCSRCHSRERENSQERERLRTTRLRQARERELRRQAARYRNVTYKGVRHERKGKRFGTEIEVVFDSAPEFEVGDYHSGHIVGAPFYGSWKSEEDGSLPYGESAELISPILEGQGGVAEVISTMRILRDFGGRMNRQCGGHVTISCEDYEARLQVMRMYTVLEEAVFATTGAFNRYNEESYCRPIKRNRYGYEYITRQNGIYEEKYMSVHGKPEAIEFRYPPGTLNATQFVVNLGLSQLAVRLAERLDTELVDKLVAQSLHITSLSSRDSAGLPKWVAFAIYGLSILRTQGWYEGGQYIGLPYNPHQPPTINLIETSRNINNTVELPSAEDIQARLHRQISRFFQRGFKDTTPGADCPYSITQIMEAALSCISAEGPNDTVKEILTTICGEGGEIVLPDATKITDRASRKAKQKQKEEEEYRRSMREARRRQAEGHTITYEREMIDVRGEDAWGPMRPTYSEYNTDIRRDPINRRFLVGDHAIPVSDRDVARVREETGVSIRDAVLRIAELAQQAEEERRRMLRETTYRTLGERIYATVHNEDDIQF